MAETDSAGVRAEILRALELDLVGPSSGDGLKEEVLPQAPSRWYLTGFLAPTGANVAQRIDETADEELDMADESGGADDANNPDPAAARKAVFPSSMGLSVLVNPDTRSLKATVRWGEYRLEGIEGASLDDSESSGELSGDESAGDEEPVDEPGREYWRRRQRESTLELTLPSETRGSIRQDVPDSGGLALVMTVRPVGERASIEGGVLAGTRSVSIFLVNNRPPSEDHLIDEAYIFQAELRFSGEKPFLPKPDLRGLAQDDWDERVADL